MILTGALLAGLALAYLLVASILKFRLGISLRQAFLYTPFKLIYRIDDSDIRLARLAVSPVIYVVARRSRIEPALMLSLLPHDTLHMLDSTSAKSPWLEPFRALARTIEFKTEHVFVSRRLVRVLKGRGRLAVYLPDNVEPDARTFRIYRAVAQIATKAGAAVVPILVSNSNLLPFSEKGGKDSPAARLPRLSITSLEAETLGGLAHGAELGRTTAANALFDRVAEARVKEGMNPASLFQAVREAAICFGPTRTIVEDAISDGMTYRELLAGARILGGKLQSTSAPGEAVGLLLPNSNGFVLALLGLLSCGRVSAMINYTAGPANVTDAIRTALIRTVVSSRAFVDKAGLADLIEVIEIAGARVLWLEDLKKTIGKLDRLGASLLWRLPLSRQNSQLAAVVLFTSGSEGRPKAVVLSNGNLVANARQVEARLALSPSDKLLNVLPVFHAYGLTGGTILPFLTGVRSFQYPSPLHFKLIPATAAKIRPTIMFATDTFLTAYARAADDADFQSLRLVVAGAEAVRTETRRIWRDRFGVEIMEGYGMTEASPVVAINTATHGRPGTVGRMVPGMRAQIEPVEGIAEGGKLWISGPNVMAGYMLGDQPGVLQPPPNGWHDSGDIVSVDREGFITIKGRTRRFAKIAGEMISLAAVEVLVNSAWPDAYHAVVSVPDRRRGERIVLVTTATEAEPHALREHGKAAGLAELTLPSHIIQVSELPTLGTGKIDYVATRRIAMDALGVDTAA